MLQDGIVVDNELKSKMTARERRESEQIIYIAINEELRNVRASLKRNTGSVVQHQLNRALEKYMDGSVEEEESSLLDTLGLPEGHGLDEEDMENAIMLGSIIAKLSNEIAEVKEQVKDQKKIHGDCKYKLETGKTKISAITRNVRDIKSKIPKHKEQIAKLWSWFDTDVKLLVDKEKNRQNDIIKHITELLNATSSAFASQKTELNELKERNLIIRADVDEFHQEKKLTETEEGWIKRAMISDQQNLESLQKTFDAQKIMKTNLLKIRYENEQRIRKEEIELMASALQKRIAQGGGCRTIEELDVISLDGKDLKRVHYN